MTMMMTMVCDGEVVVDDGRDGEDDHNDDHDDDDDDGGDDKQDDADDDNADDDRDGGDVHSDDDDDDDKHDDKHDDDDAGLTDGDDDVCSVMFREHGSNQLTKERKSLDARPLLALSALKSFRPRCRLCLLPSTMEHKEDCATATVAMEKFASPNRCNCTRPSRTQMYRGGVRLALFVR